MEVDLKHKGAAAAVPGQRRVRWLAPVHTIGSDEHPFIDKFDKRIVWKEYVN